MTSLIVSSVFDALLVLAVLCIFLYSLALMISSVTPAMYVPSGSRQVRRIFETMTISKDSVFIDLGCGDGKVVHYVAKRFGARALGIDINPLLIAWARLRAWLLRLPNATFKLQNIMHTDVGNADYIYVFLLPSLLERLERKFSSELKPGCTVISHGFRIKNWESMLVQTVSGNPFSTYVYRFRR